MKEKLILLKRNEKQMRILRRTMMLAFTIWLITFCIFEYSESLGIKIPVYIEVMCTGIWAALLILNCFINLICDTKVSVIKNNSLPSIFLSDTRATFRLSIIILVLLYPVIDNIPVVASIKIVLFIFASVVLFIVSKLISEYFFGKLKE